MRTSKPLDHNAAIERAGFGAWPFSPRTCRRSRSLSSAMTKSAPDARGRVTIPSAVVVAGAALMVVVAGIISLHAVRGMTVPLESKILGIAFAVGLDVLALSIAVGIMRLPWRSRMRLGIAFSGAEVVMQVVGYAVGTGAGQIVGTIADYVGFAVLAAWVSSSFARATAPRIHR